MLISCEKCSTKYLVPDEAISAAGRLVKCSSCSHKWIQYPQNPDVRTNPAESYGDLPRNQSLQPIPAAGGVSFGFKAATVLLILLAIPLFLLASFPQSDSYNNLFEKVGIFKTDGIEFQDLEFRKVKRDDKYVLIIKGSVANTSDKILKIEGIRIVITDERDNKMTSLIYNADKKMLNPGEKVPFEPKVANVPEAAEKIFVDIGNGLELVFRKNKT